MQRFLLKTKYVLTGSPLQIRPSNRGLGKKANKRVLGVPLKLLLYQAANEKGTGFNRWLRSKGEPPVIYDSIESVLSLARLNRAYRKLGYFNTASRFDLSYSKQQKKVKQQFSVTTGDRFTVDSIGLKIDNPNMRALIEKHSSSSLIASGKFVNIDALEAERQRLLNALRNEGAFGLQNSNIRFEIDGDTTQTNTSKN